MNKRINSDIVDWVTTNFLPFEADLRVMLRRVCASREEIDDVVQEAYYKVLQLRSVDHVEQPRPFLVRLAKNIVVDRMRRDAIVSMEAMANLEELQIASDAPTPERVVLARTELEWVFNMIEKLPERCRAVFRSRRVYGLSQLETANSLGITEGIVEQENMKGMQLLSDMLAIQGIDDGYANNLSRKTKRATKKSNGND